MEISRRCAQHMPDSPSKSFSVAVPILFMAVIGAACWQPVRIGGDGAGWTMGLLWGLAWLFCSAAYGTTGNRGYGRPWVVLALVAGFYLGGMHGYGQFHTWVQGYFELSRAGERTVPIHPLYGWFWLYLCGLGWGGVAGVVLVWLGNPLRHSWRAWLLVTALVPACAFALRAMAIARPDWIMPLYAKGYYADADLCPDCTRTVETLQQSMMWLGFLLGGFLATLIARKWREAAVILVMGVGFGVAFIAFEWLLLFYDAKRGDTVHWWSLWEASVGMGGGAVLGVCFVLLQARGHVKAGEAASAVPYTRSELALGLVLPLLLSLHTVLPFRIARGAAWLFGVNQLELRETLAGVLMPLLVLAGLYLLYRMMRTPMLAPSRKTAALFAHVFLGVYLSYFLISYLPRFALQHLGAGLWFTQGTYAAAFLLSVLLFVQIHKLVRTSETEHTGKMDRAL